MIAEVAMNVDPDQDVAPISVEGLPQQQLVSEEVDALLVTDPRVGSAPVELSGDAQTREQVAWAGSLLRRAATGIVISALTSGILGGWAALKPIMTSAHVLLATCDAAETAAASGRFASCVAQDLALDSIFQAASFCVNFLLLPVAFAKDAMGRRAALVIAAALLAAGLATIGLAGSSPALSTDALVSILRLAAVSIATGGLLVYAAVQDFATLARSAAPMSVARWEAMLSAVGAASWDLSALISLLLAQLFFLGSAPFRWLFVGYAAFVFCVVCAFAAVAEPGPMPGRALTPPVAQSPSSDSNGTSAVAIVGDASGTCSCDDVSGPAGETSRGVTPESLSAGCVSETARRPCCAHLCAKLRHAAEWLFQVAKPSPSVTAALCSTLCLATTLQSFVSSTALYFFLSTFVQSAKWLVAPVATGGGGLFGVSADTLVTSFSVVLPLTGIVVSVPLGWLMTRRRGEASGAWRGWLAMVAFAVLYACAGAVPALAAQAISWLAFAAFRIGTYAVLFQASNWRIFHEAPRFECTLRVCRVSIQHVRDLFPVEAFVWVAYGASCCAAGIGAFAAQGIETAVSSVESYRSIACANVVSAVAAALVALWCAWLSRPSGVAAAAVLEREAELKSSE